MGLLELGAAFVVGAAAGAVGALTLTRSQRVGPDVDTDVAAPGVDPGEVIAARRAAEAAAEERDAALQICMELADRLRADGSPLQGWLEDRLEGAGIDAVGAAPGEVYRVEAHEVVDRAKTDEPDRDGTVESMVSVGYRKGEEWVRRPKVVVYAFDGIA